MTDEEALERATLQLAAIIKSSDVAIYSQDLDGIITSWNRASETLFGYTAVEVLGKAASATTIPPSRRAEEEEVLQRVRSGHGVQHYETIRQRKDGTLLDVSITVSPVRNSAADIVGLSKIARDITFQKRLEQDARQLAAIIESSEDSIIGKDLNGTILSWNHAAEELFGFRAAEAIGESIRMIIPEDRWEEEDRVLRRIGRGESVKHFETVRRRKDGTMISVSVTASPVRGADGTVVAVSQSARDVTARQQIERDARQLAAIVRSSEDAIVGKDLNSTITSWNHAAEEMFGYSAAEAISQSIRMIIPEDRQGEEDDVLRRIRNGESIRHFETVRRRKDGTLVPVSLTVSPIRSDDGTVIGASKIARDISVEKRAAQRAAFLTEASHLLAGSVDYEATLTAIANLAVPSVADWCAVDIVTSGGRIERLAGAHVDPSKIEIVRTIRECYEDSDSLMLGREILESAGAQVTTVDSSEVVLEEIASVRPDVLIADVGLPRLDGYELIKRIRQLPDSVPRNTPAIAITAYARAEDRVKALQSGFQMHLAKPVDPAELIVAVAALAKRFGNRTE